MQLDLNESQTPSLQLIPQPVAIGGDESASDVGFYVVVNK